MFNKNVESVNKNKDMTFRKLFVYLYGLSSAFLHTQKHHNNARNIFNVQYAILFRERGNNAVYKEAEECDEDLSGKFNWQSRFN